MIGWNGTNDQVSDPQKIISAWSSKNTVSSFWSVGNMLEIFDEIEKKRDSFDW